MSDRLFTPGPASDPWYLGLRDSTDARTNQIREWCEVLWARHEPYADAHFLTEIRRDFHARFWEMYLTVTLLELGHRIACPKPGPDVGIEVDGRRIWFEAVAPKPGDGGDRVPPIVLNQFTAVPNEQLVLRYLNAINNKLTEQFPRWRAAGIVADGDALVIAINPRSLGRDVLDSTPPRILQAAFPMGAPYATLDSEGGGVLGEGYTDRPAIRKRSGNEVRTGAFLEPTGVDLSGLLCSRADASTPAATLSRASNCHRVSGCPARTTRSRATVTRSTLRLSRRPHHNHEHCRITTASGRYLGAARGVAHSVRHRGGRHRRGVACSPRGRPALARHYRSRA